MNLHSGGGDSKLFHCLYASIHCLKQTTYCDCLLFHLYLKIIIDNVSSCNFVSQHFHFQNCGILVQFITDCSIESFDFVDIISDQTINHQEWHDFETSKVCVYILHPDCAAKLCRQNNPQKLEVLLNSLALTGL